MRKLRQLLLRQSRAQVFHLSGKLPVLLVLLLLMLPLQLDREGLCEGLLLTRGHVWPAPTPRPHRQQSQHHPWTLHELQQQPLKRMYAHVLHPAIRLLVAHGLPQLLRVDLQGEHPLASVCPVRVVTSRPQPPQHAASNRGQCLAPVRAHRWSSCRPSALPWTMERGALRTRRHTLRLWGCSTPHRRCQTRQESVAWPPTAWLAMARLTPLLAKPLAAFCPMKVWLLPTAGLALAWLAAAEPPSAKLLAMFGPMKVWLPPTAWLVMAWPTAAGPPLAKRLAASCCMTVWLAMPWTGVVEPVEVLPTAAKPVAAHPVVLWPVTVGQSVAKRVRDEPAAALPAVVSLAAVRPLEASPEAASPTAAREANQQAVA
mmetsp:Transcript_139262/g.388640  ORF Transcript_139262/g.388640 Transcript_139262/m.388640 type:complete len:372 (+) Transcript_139262:920-2035(+)